MQREKTASVTLLRSASSTRHRPVSPKWRLQSPALQSVDNKKCLNKDEQTTDQIYNKCIRDDTKAAARQSLNCIKKKKNMAKNDYQYAVCGMWLWNRDSVFTKWQHPAMWYVALGWHAIEFAQTCAILEFYNWFLFPHITAVDMSFCTRLQNFIHIRPPSAEKNYVISIFKMADLSHLGL